MNMREKRSGEILDAFSLSKINSAMERKTKEWNERDGQEQMRKKQKKQ